MINKKICLFIINLLLFTHIKAQIIYTAEFNKSDLQIEEITGEDNNQYSTLVYKGLENHNTPGHPELPVSYLRFSVPSHISDFTISIDEIKKENITIKYNIFPAQIPIPTSFQPNSVAFTTPESTIYSSRNNYPAEQVKIINDGFLDGDKHILTIAVTPVSYSPLEKEIEFITSISFKINYNSASTFNQQINNNKKIVRRVVKEEKNNQTIERLKSFVANPQDVEINIHSAGNAAISPTAAVNIGLPYYEYCVITTRALSSSFERLVNWKRQKGITAGVICIEDIKNNSHLIEGDQVSNIKDDAGKLRAYLTYAYQAGTTYVLFGGNDRILPIRYGTGNSGSWDRRSVDKNGVVHIETDGAKIPTDLYFSDLNGNWNSNGNIYLGEPTDKLDYYPELYVGRILCNNASEVENYTTKLMRYEKKPGNSTSASYLRKGFYSQSSDLQDRNQAQGISESLKEKFPSYTIVEEPEDKNSPTGATVIKTINNRYGFVGLFHHASPEGMFVSGKGHAVCTYADYQLPWAIKETGNAWDNLTNELYPMIIHSVGCSHTPFDKFNPNGVPAITHNTGESLTTRGLYGGPAFLGNTRVGWVISSYTLMNAFVERINSGEYKIGIAEAMSKAVNTGSKHWLALAHNLIGCPEFEMWTDTPVTYGSVSISGTNTSPSVSTGVTGSIITAKGIFGGDSKISSKTGSGASFSGMPTNYIITVHKHNRLPYIAPLYAQNESVTGKHYLHLGDVYMGKNITDNKTQGDLVIKKGAEVVIEKTGTLVLDGGFEIELGAAFEVKDLY